MTRIGTLTIGVTVVAFLGIAVGTRAIASQSASAQQEQDHQAHHPGAEVQSPNTPAAKPTEPQKGMQQKMMADRKLQEAKLDALVARLKTTKGEARVDAVVELLTSLVEQHKSMQQSMMVNPAMMQMHSGMMEKAGAAK